MSAIAFELTNTADPSWMPPGGLILQSDWFGPDGGGIDVHTAAATTLAWASARWASAARRSWWPAYPVDPVYSTCQHEILPCETQEFFFVQGVSNESQIWSRVKAMFWSGRRAPL